MNNAGQSSYDDVRRFRGQGQVDQQANWPQEQRRFDTEADAAQKPYDGHLDVPQQMQEQPVRESASSIAWPSIDTSAPEQRKPPKPQNFTYAQQEIQNDPERPNFDFRDDGTMGRNRPSHGSWQIDKVGPSGATSPMGVGHGEHAMNEDRSFGGQPTGTHTNSGQQHTSQNNQASADSGPAQLSSGLHGEHDALLDENTLSKGGNGNF